MKFERFVLSLILTQEHREVIWQSLEEARVASKAAKDLEKMGRLELVMHKIGGYLGTRKDPLFNEDILMHEKIAEVLKLESDDVTKVLESIYKRGVQEGLQKFEQVRREVETQLCKDNN